MIPFFIYPKYAGKCFVQGFGFLENGYHWWLFISYDGQFLDAQCFGNDGIMMVMEPDMSD